MSVQSTSADRDDRLSRLSPERRALLARVLAPAPPATTAPKHGATITPNPSARHEPFPLTGTQQAYRIGRSGDWELGNLASRAYVEMEAPSLDRERFSTALNDLIARHDALRLVVHPDGTQEALANVPPYAVQELDLVGLDVQEAEEQREALRREMLEALRPAEEWPLFDVRLSTGAGPARIHFAIDLLLTDAGSIAILFRDLAALYAGEGDQLSALPVTFRDYVLADRAGGESPDWQRAESYWRARIPSIAPAPALPLAKDPSNVAQSQFMRRTDKLGTDATARLEAHAAAAGVSLSSALLALYGDVLGRWSTDAKLTVNIPIFNRKPLHPAIDDVVGAFTSIELLTLDTAPGQSFRERARTTQAQLLDDLDHRAFDGIEVMRELRLSGGPDKMPVVFTSLVEVGYNDAAAKLGTIVYAVNQTAQVWMDLHVDKQDGRLLVKWDAVDELFPPGMPSAMVDAYMAGLRALSESESAWERTNLDLLPSDQAEMRAALNATAAPVPDGLIQDFTFEHGERRPDTPAVISQGRTVSHGELRAQAIQLGRSLADSGVGPGDLVAVVMEKGWEQVVAPYATLVSGAAYVPIDPASPPERLQHLLTHSGAKAVLTQSHIERALAWPPDLRITAVDALPTSESAPHKFETPRVPGQLAYVLYTSGSTGLPKGVMVEHASVVNRMVDVHQRFGITHEERAIGLTALQHDLSIIDMFGILMAGGAVVLPRPELRLDPAHWLECIDEGQVTFWNSVPAFVEMFVEYLETCPPQTVERARSLKRIVMSGDWIPMRLIPRLQALLPHIEVISAGGPTETTVWDICFPVAGLQPEWNSVPYGRPMTNARYYILDGHLRDCPDWVSGEIYIGGVGLARGYWRDDELTSRAFVTHPRTGERIYRSGDLGRFRPEGWIEFMGRADFQVKIQGQRIELGEIEATLDQHPSVAACVATVRDRAGTRFIAAYVVPAPGGSPDASTLDAFLRQKLPAHMIPRTFTLLEKLPLSANGKVDRRALPDPDTEGGSGQRGAQAVPAAAQAVARIVAEVLGVDEPPADADLIAMGASSLELVRIGNKLEAQFGTRPRIDELFRLRTIGALASHFGAGMQPAQTEKPSDDRVAHYDVLLDPDEVAAFKSRHLAWRTAGMDQKRIALPAIDEQRHAARCQQRKSHRQFALRPVSLKMLAELFGATAPVQQADGLKYAHASPGGIYPIQLYLHAKPGRIEGLPGGIYYYHPVERELIAIKPGAEIEREIHIPFINQPTFDECAFSLFLVARLDAIGPVYGAHSLRFATIEAGIIAHALELAAIDAGLGICQIGSIDWKSIRDLFDLEPDHELVHSLMGGLPATPNGGVAQGVSAAERVAALAARISDLSPAEVQELLAANERGKS